MEFEGDFVSCFSVALRNLPALRVDLTRPGTTSSDIQLPAVEDRFVSLSTVVQPTLVSANDRPMESFAEGDEDEACEELDSQLDWSDDSEPETHLEPLRDADGNPFPHVSEEEPEAGHRVRFAPFVQVIAVFRKTLQESPAEFQKRLGLDSLYFD